MDVDAIIMALYVIGYTEGLRFATPEPLGPGGSPYPAMFGKPDSAILDSLVAQTAAYWRQREEELRRSASSECLVNGSDNRDDKMENAMQTTYWLHRALAAALIIVASATATIAGAADSGCDITGNWREAGKPFQAELIVDEPALPAGQKRSFEQQLAGLRTRL